MRQIERVADGRRRFFQADGVVSDVLLRDRKSHHDRGLERGRDYEIETGGVVLTTVPKQGATVIILAGDRVRESVVRPDATPALAPSFTFPSAGGAPPIAGPLTQPLTTIESTAPVLLDQPDELVFTKDADGSLTIELDALKRALVLATKDTNDATPRTVEWQDELARLTAIMLKAETLNGVKSAFMDIERYLRGET